MSYDEILNSFVMEDVPEEDEEDEDGEEAEVPDDGEAASDYDGQLEEI
ncbi:MAG: hypothetical protein HYT20_00030 [Candidatus Nealsonbacteria bacterium]|nr:hypothetical protein [Candidatus Nealsonbacteria bacterium]